MKRLLVCLGLLMAVQAVHAQTYDVRCASRMEGGKKINEQGRFIYNKDKKMVVFTQVNHGQELTFQFWPDKSDYNRVALTLNDFRFAYKLKDNQQLFLFTIGTPKPIDTKIADLDVSFTAKRVEVRPDGLVGGVYTTEFASCKYTYTP